MKRLAKKIEQAKKDEQAAEAKKEARREKDREYSSKRYYREQEAKKRREENFKAMKEKELKKLEEKQKKIEEKKFWWLIIATNGPQREKTPTLLYANNKGADQPAHAHSLISVFVMSYLESILTKLVAVVATKSDSDVILCLQLLSKILICTLHLS